MAPAVRIEEVMNALRMDIQHRHRNRVTTFWATFSFGGDWVVLFEVGRADAGGERRVACYCRDGLCIWDQACPS